MCMTNNPYSFPHTKRKQPHPVSTSKSRPHQKSLRTFELPILESNTPPHSSLKHTFNHPQMDTMHACLTWAPNSTMPTQDQSARRPQSHGTTWRPPLPRVATWATSWCHSYHEHRHPGIVFPVVVPMLKPGRPDPQVSTTAPPSAHNPRPASQTTRNSVGSALVPWPSPTSTSCVLNCTFGSDVKSQLN